MTDVHAEAGRRTYTSEVRTQQAADTRARIAAAAGACFAESGWSGTTLAQIARRAGVTPQAVHLSIGPKPALLKVALVAAVGAGEADDPELEREVFRGVGAPGLTIEDRARAFAAASQAVHERAGRLFAVLAQAAQTDEELAEWRRSIAARRMEVCKALVKSCEVDSRHCERARDLVFVLSSTSVYYEFNTLGWSSSKYLGWLVPALVQALSG